MSKRIKRYAPHESVIICGAFLLIALVTWILGMVITPIYKRGAMPCMGVFGECI